MKVLNGIFLLFMFVVLITVLNAYLEDRRYEKKKQEERERRPNDGSKFDESESDKTDTPVP